MKITATMPREDWVALYDALSYAIDEREYEASQTPDVEDWKSLTECAGQWIFLQERIYKLVGWD